jgi:hypothetical protein
MSSNFHPKAQRLGPRIIAGIYQGAPCYPSSYVRPQNRSRRCSTFLSDGGQYNGSSRPLAAWFPIVILYVSRTYSASRQ